MLHFQKLPDNTSTSAVISERLLTELRAEKQVLWLLSGGSNIAVEVAALNAIPSALRSNLTIMLSDERFGPYGHKDSNMQQLYDAGLEPGDAHVIPVIVPESLPMTASTTHYEDNVRQAFAAADVSIVQLGMGSDGHIAGILPHSPAVSAKGLVTSYNTENFDRVTLTFQALQQATATYVFAFGQDKGAQLVKLRDADLPVDEQPAQILKQFAEVYVYNDQLDSGESD